MPTANGLSPTVNILIKVDHTMAQQTILVVDDEAHIRRLERVLLQQMGFLVTETTDGEAALDALATEPPSLVILDINLPKLDGFEVCKSMREWSDVPIIMVSARQDEADKVRTLDSGADDYITKPFGSDEFKARVAAVLRRSTRQTSVEFKPPFVAGEFQLDFSAHMVTIAGTEIPTSATEYNLLCEFVGNIGRVLTHEMLLQRIWGAEYSGESDYVRQYVHRLRQKLDTGSDFPLVIETIQGVGYIMKSV